ncbi:hypothetical protein ASPWEDRAFT_115097 [Aspergillus wentii DTO 134E9]|uniref:Major facilitator superfamily (MFS) profile domain-containing protein n=1 Tax=Aspergillus wentii DTO 134E9 TaxID=1073089 RepID=A0A1L9RF38_ASPWE|nr:uncharacterized protein ASPWEDRAFT_115097 [Aspergillus wentii DTO 134E9]OJJ33487.1 hypothetical protein ASPWEDRAFT_115097 [Aspergillus wentii DTO 134E9]
MANHPWGSTWRSSTAFIIVCITTALFAESFLYGFIVPILPFILEDRSHVDPADTQRLTYQVLTLYGGVAVVSGIVIGQLADRAKSRKLPLIVGLGIAFVGTLVLATATGLPGVFVGRFLQAVGGTAAWIVGFATLRDTIEAKDIGKTFGLVNSFVGAGALSGPAVAGLLLQLAGYWVTWGTVLVVIMLDIVMRFVMIENPRKKRDQQKQDQQPGVTEETEEATENSALLAGSSQQQQNSTPSVLSFYQIILSQPRVIVGLLSYTTYSSLAASYNTTIPIHVRASFGWESLQTGLIFAALQAPNMLLSPLCGWLRDRMGTRLPTAVGFILLSPLLWLLGAADQTQFPWAAHAQVVYIVAIVIIGCVQNLLTSVGTIEITCAVDDLESKTPGIFGPNGGYSRAYSLSNVSFTMGFLLGPLLSGSLVDAFGYYTMNSVLASVCVVLSLLALTFLHGKSSVRGQQPQQNESA